MLCSIRVCLNLHLPGCYVQFTTNFPRVRHETKKTLSCIISGKNAIATPTFQNTTRNQKDIILHHFRKECNCKTKFSRVRHETKKTLSCIISEKNAITQPTFPEHDTKPKRHYPASFPARMQLHHQLSQSTTRNQKDIILHHFRKECNCNTNFPERDTKPKTHYVQYAFV